MLIILLASDGFGLSFRDNDDGSPFEWNLVVRQRKRPNDALRSGSGELESTKDILLVDSGACLLRVRLTLRSS